MKHPRLWLTVSLALLLPCCTDATGPKPQWLMPTPQIYLKGGVNPFQSLSHRDRTTVLPVHFATNRKHSGGYFGSSLEPKLSYGVIPVGIGGEHTRWPELESASTSAERSDPLPLRFVGFSNGLPSGAIEDRDEWLKALDQATRRTRSRDVVIYVHGAKVEFFHSCAFSAEIAHFTGRDLTPVAFDWPTHPDILSYVLRIDLSHAIHSASRLADLVRDVAKDTSTRRIHLVSWSAGARVLSRAMVDLAGDDIEAARKRYRIGSCVFAAGDVPKNDFIARLPSIHGLSERVTIYTSDADGALAWSSRLMGGGNRLGLDPKALDPGDIVALRDHPRVQVVDCSMGKDKRGFDITGHRYWYQHPWVSSDVMLTLRTSASPDRRGLTPAEIPGIHYFAPDYGDRIGAVARGLIR